MLPGLYKYSEETRSRLKQFRLSTSRSQELKCLIVKIVPKPSYIITIDEESVQEAENEVETLGDLRELLPDNQPRYVLVNYPTTTKDGRKSSILAMLYWKPSTVVSQELKMLYVGALEFMKAESSPNRFVEVSNGLEDEEDVEELIGQLAM